MKKIAFFDIDGTLCDSSGQVLPSSKESIQAFRDKGNLTYICTGRSKPEILDSILEVGFDGIIGAGGGYIVINDEVVKHQTMDERIVREVLSYFKEHDIGYYLETNDGLYGSDNCVRKIREEIKTIAEKTNQDYDGLAEKVSWFEAVLEEHKNDEVDYTNVNKISFINNTVSFSDVADKFGDECYMYHSTVELFGPESGEIAVKGVDKKLAIEYVLNKLGMTKEQTIAFGDGDNDIVMFEAVDYSIAMDNATDNLKKIASEITDSADDDGIAKSLKRNGWV
ncbi:Cof-type HAD-IIB family hydrolase [Vagococcus teuberi]|uniref:HAD family hydrolase n=1 Tax=Vagococcus teuberi TaxID=519472 RepID=A0A1J0A3M7_9ENTE|nr:MULTISPECIES: Cof-type HAD-IIB family hydrolase [Vagococcus]APB30536.1 HAD family hydrolase [Vagococcus teuberi]RHH68682.1 Cof-type HAD-IIB family hydrolase [Vagococcus sp. AM17-17]